MSRKKRFINDLTENELITLEQGFKYGNSPDFRKRCQMVLLNHKRREVNEIVDILGGCPQAVYTTLRKWEENGICGLIRKKGQGRKPKLSINSAEHVKQVQNAVKQHPQSTRKILEEVTQKLNIEPMSERNFRRLLKKLVTPGSDFAGG